MYTFQHRDAWDWAESLIVDPLMCRRFVWHAYKQFKRINGEWVRFLDEPYTADRLYNFEVCLVRDTGVIADAEHASVHSSTRWRSPAFRPVF